jgi:hypothetical protein
VIGILADNNAIGLVRYLVQQMHAPPWSDFWQALGLVEKSFADVGLAPASSPRISVRLPTLPRLGSWYRTPLSSMSDKVFGAEMAPS